MSADCAIFYTRYCTTELLPFAIIGMAFLIVFIALQMRGGRRRNTGDVTKPTIVILLMVAGLVILVNAGSDFSGLGPFGRSIRACSQRHFAAYVHSCKR